MKLIVNSSLSLASAIMREAGKIRAQRWSNLAAAGPGAKAAVAIGWSVRSRSGVGSWLAPSTLAAIVLCPSVNSSSPVHKHTNDSMVQLK